ncbi:hypothetical protein LXL04_004826 [Taraxacum kok-saghyz]
MSQQCYKNDFRKIILTIEKTQTSPPSFLSFPCESMRLRHWLMVERPRYDVDGDVPIGGTNKRCMVEDVLLVGKARKDDDMPKNKYFPKEKSIFRLQQIEDDIFKFAKKFGYVLIHIFVKLESGASEDIMDIWDPPLLHSKLQDLGSLTYGSLQIQVEKWQAYTAI